MVYSDTYIKAVNKKVKAAENDFTRNFEFTVDGGFNQPPMLEIVRAMDVATLMKGNMDVESKDRLLRYSIVGKKVDVAYKGKPLGSFVMNNLTDAWEVFPVLQQNPVALRKLMEMAVEWMMEKSLPPQISGDPSTAAAEATNESNGSPAK
jgi:hypothetical protein